MRKPTLPFVETMITQVCNLSCTGCTNYSDLQHEGYVTWKQGKLEIERWLERVDILDFGILGGEPLINPEVSEWIYGLRELMPDAQIRFTTNGILLKKSWHVVEQLAEIGNCVFKITLHKENFGVRESVQKIVDSYGWRPVKEHGINRYVTDNNFRFHFKEPAIFWKTFKGPYHDMKPHHSVPSEAFRICSQQTCPLLYKGRIYKCSTAGLLADTLARFGNPNIEEWKGYIDQGISPDCSDEELTRFLDNFGKPNKICGQCPTEKDISSRIDHLKFVERKKKK